MKFLTHNRPGTVRRLSRSPAIVILTLIIATSILYGLSNMTFNSTSLKIGDLDHTLEPVAKPLDTHEDAIAPREEDNVPFMPKMGNATLRAELGRASWKLFHTIMARYPDEPTKAQRNHLDNYITSFSQVYPCGDCARHFVKLLEKYPPQLNSRKNAAIWGCFVHNQVNKALHHEQYDCTTILEDYDCGCGVDEETADYTLKGKTMKDVQDKLESSEQQEHLQSIHVESTEEHIPGK